MEIQITATFDKDSRRYHRFLVDEGQEVKGAIYIAKDATIPEKVTISLKTAADKDQNDKG